MKEYEIICESMEIISLVEVCELTGINKSTLRKRLKKHGIKSISYNKYERDSILQIAQIPTKKENRQKHNGEPCTRCGTHDYGNECRGGLCFECFAHDYCKAKGI